MTPASFLLAILFLAVLMSAAMTLAFLIERRTGNSGWIDVVWTFGLGTTGFVAALLPFGEGPLPRRLLVAGLVLAWSLRLGLHIAGRTRGIGDDPRYARLKQGWGQAKERQMFRLFQIQALVSVPLAIGVLLAAHNPRPALGWQDALGIFVFLVGIVGGGIADRQLRAFARDPARSGQICDQGFWAWSRHPNYFFESVLWCSYPLIAFAMSGYPCGFAALLAPACITLLLTKISGIPPLEEHMLSKHGATYRRYQQRTSAFLPLPPGRSAGA